MSAKPPAIGEVSSAILIRIVGIWAWRARRCELSEICLSPLEKKSMHGECLEILRLSISISIVDHTSDEITIIRTPDLLGHKPVTDFFGTRKASFQHANENM